MKRLAEFGVHLLTTKHDVHKLLDYGVKLDRWGFDHLKVGDHTLTLNLEVEYPNAHTILSAVGALTKRIKLSTNVTDPFRRHPVEIAQGIATLDKITRGRAVLGIGAGEIMNLAPFGIRWERPYTRIKEALEVIKLLWSSNPRNPVNFRGEIFGLENAYLQLKCHQEPRPPIYLGALGPKMRELAGLKADGWAAVSAEAPETLRLHLNDVKRGLVKRGGRIEDFYVSATIYTETGDSEEAYGTVEAGAKSALAMSRDILENLGHKIVAPKEISVQRLRVNDPQLMDRLKEIAETIPRNIVERTVAIGSPDQCIDRLEEFLGAGVNSITICSLSKDDDRLYRRYAEKIVPYLKENYSD